jgi:hypothetical protein
MTLDFDNDEQYRKFVKDVAENIYLYNPQLFHEEIADYVVDGLMGIDHRRDLAEAILQQLLAYYDANSEDSK